MSEKGIVLTDYISYLYFIYYLIKTSISFVVALIWIAIIIKNIKQKYVDVLKIIQSCILFIYFIWRCIFNPFIKALESKEWKDIHEGLNQLTDTWFLYYSLNQFSLYILSQHLITYRKLNRGKSYEEWRTEIKNKEWRLVCWIITLNVTIILSLACLWFISSKSEHSPIIRAISSEIAFISLIIAISEYLSNRIVVKTLRSELNFYYNKKRNILNFLWFINIWWFLMWFIVNLVLTIYDIDIDDLEGLNPNNCTANLIFITYAVNRNSLFLYLTVLMKRLMTGKESCFWWDRYLFILLISFMFM